MLYQSTGGGHSVMVRSLFKLSDYNLGPKPGSYAYSGFGDNTYTEAQIRGLLFDQLIATPMGQTKEYFTFDPVALYDADHFEQLSLRHSAPFKVKYLPYEDALLYASMLSRVGTALGVLSDDKANKLRFEKEKRVIHGTTEGTLMPPSSLIYETIYHTPESLWDEDIDKWVCQSPYKMDGNGFLNLLGNKTTKYYCRLEDAVEIFRRKSEEPQPHFSSQAGPWVHTQSLLSVGFEKEDYECGLHYQIREEYYSVNSPDENYTSCIYDIDIVWTPEWRLMRKANTLITSTPTGVYGPYWMPFYSNFYVTRHSCKSGGSTYPQPAYEPGHMEFVSKTTPHVTIYIGSAIDEPKEIEARWSRHFYALDRNLHRNFYEIAGSAYVSASQAVSDHRTIINANYVETVAELGELLRLMPNLAPIEDFLSLLPQGRLIAGTIRMIDFASDTYLLAQYGILAYKSDILEFAKKYDSIAKKLRDKLRADLDLRGKFTYTFPEGDVLSGYTLTVRSKVMITFPVGSVSSALLPFEANGILPTPSALWDTIPFSFVADWFTNNSTRWDLGEAYVHACFAQVHYCVHSYTLQKYLLAADLPESLADYRLATGASYKYYIRTKSKYFPSPSSGRYDWLAPAGDPPPLEAGALLWSLIRRQ